MEGPPIHRLLEETGLPLVPRLAGICGALEERKTAVVRADPGSGKSTLLPLALLDRTSGEGRIVMLEGRRAAAAGIAGRMAELLGEQVGERIGYSVRMERRLSPRTRVEVLTEGLLVRRIQGDPGLRGISTVIFDEFHERSVHTDLALALILDLRRMGLAVRLLIMSATMDASRIGAFIDAAEDRRGADKTPVFDCPGRRFPVKTEYRPIPGKGPLGAECGRALLPLLREGEEGDVLVFLPGKGEIAAAARVLQEAGLPSGTRLLPLHGGLPLARQREVIAGGGTGRRVILSTNVAETALTVPGVTLVVDSGYARIERFHLPTGMNRLVREPVSLQAADQRAGRAGRLMPGRCVRLWEEAAPRPAETDREIHRIDLAGLVLECLLWGVRRREELPWPDMPPEGAWDRALDLLRRLGAADGEGKATPRGREMARLGLHPRLGALCLAGDAAGQGALAAAGAAILSERDGSAVTGDADFRRRLALIRRSGGPGGSQPPGGGAGAEPPVYWARSVRTAAAELLRRLGRDSALSWTAAEEASVGELLKAAFPDRIARRQESSAFRLSSGREGTVQGPLAAAEWIVAVEADAGERAARIDLAAPLSPEGALEALEGELLTETAIEWKDLVPRSVVTRRAGRLLISETRRPSLRAEVIPELPALLREKTLGVLPWEDGARRLLDRIRFFAAFSAASSGRRGPSCEAASWTDEALAETASQWIGPLVWDGNEQGRGPVIEGAGLRRALEGRLGFSLLSELDRAVPAVFTLPRGKQRPLDYACGEPVLRCRLQDAFGINEIPRILGVPLVFHLLSPADRPIQITSDLPGFWAGSYAQVRKEMRGRYPKHAWPEEL